MDIAVVEIETRSSTTGFVNQAFTKADSGDLLGYAEQIRRVANRSVPLPVVVEPRLNALYNDALRKVREGLGNLIIDLIDDAGLQLISQNVPRQLDGWLPPEYGGGVIQPRWRLSNTYDGPWLEAAVGVSHRAWPTTNLNDLVITLIIAVMSDQAQHTLLTRFVPFELDDLSLRDKINALVVDVRAILPSAIEVLRNVSVNQPRRNR